ncbi:CCHC-type domain-containing protein [Trichonephila clavipes]|nr:CCHC-type domain-containing protein [Trichonephila clavipes]
MGKPMEEMYQCYQLLKCLPSKFDSIVQNILRWTDETFKYKRCFVGVDCGRNQNRFRDGLNLQRNQHEMFSVQKSKIKCHYCGKFGHFRRECRNGTAASSGTSNRRSRTYRNGPELRQHPSVSSPIGSSVTSDEFNYNSFRGGRRDRNYSFKDRNELSRYHGSANSVVHQNQAINGVEFPIEGKGDVKIWFNDHECLLKNVFFSSKLRKNLMSGSMLDLNGLKFIGKNGQIKVYAGNKQIFKANLEQGLYYAYPDVEPKYASSIEKSVKIKGKPNDLRIWHERFGHANVDYILKTSRLNAKPQQSNGGAVLASPNLKFSNYEVFENGDDDTDEDERVHNIPISLPQDSDSKTEGENLSRTENSTVPVKTTWKRVVIPRADGSRNDIYFYEVGKSQRLRSCNEIKKYCKDRNLEFDENIFSFKGKDTFEGIVNPQPSVSGVQSVKVKNNA